MLIRGLFAAASFFVVSNLYAQALEFTVGDKSASLNWGMTVGATNVGRTEVNLGVLYNEDKNFLGEIGLLVVDVAGTKSPGLMIAIGPNFYFATGDKGDVAAIGLGGELRYKLPSLNRLFFGFIGYYAPNIVTFSDSDNFYELGANIGYEILPTADIFLGYRNIVADFGNLGDEKFDESFHFGMRFRF